jgi:protein-S-isoprenylcysteine O-methyltransferase Ste14
MATHRSTHDAHLAPAIARRFVQVVLGLAVYVALLFVGAGRTSWGWGWVYAATMLALVSVTALILPPDLIAERGRKKENVEPWDRTITRLATLPYLALPLLAGLDARFGWSPPLPLGAHLAGLALVVLGHAAFAWAMLCNRFFSTAVRIQHERGHTLETGGPYRWLRHPGYAATIVGQLATALLLGSLWALVPATVISALFVVRTALEDRTLQRKLPGYALYATRVRHRLLPWVW